MVLRLFFAAALAFAALAVHAQQKEMRTAGMVVEDH